MATEAVTRERPIIFGAPMVRAILDGKKTQTRRVVQNPKGSGVDVHQAEWVEQYANALGPRPCWSFMREMSKDHPAYGRRLACNSIAIDTIRCPCGQPGDRLWVREAFYDRADYASIMQLSRERYVYVADGVKGGWINHSPIHMPRAASRITLEITGVRVERLQDISEADAAAEGADLRHFDGENWSGWGVGSLVPDGPIPPRYTRRAGFRDLWDSFNADRGFDWTSNPWVWVVEFRRLTHD